MRTLLLLYALALAVRLVLVALFPDPAYPDSSYYVAVARNLAEGRGFIVDFVWIFAEVGGTIPPDPVLPIPSNAHWMPLASLVQVPFIVLLGPTAVASALPFALIGSLAAPLAWAIARDAGARRDVALGAGLLTAIPALSLVYMTQPDNFSLFQPLVAAALWLAARGLRGDGRAFAIAGLLAGLATLSRNDGVLVAAVLGAAVGWDRWRARRSGPGAAPRISIAAAGAAAALFLLCVGPWWARQLATFGTISPSTASGKVLFIRSIEEWNSIRTPATLEHLLGQGWGPLLASRLGGLVAAGTIFATLVGAVVLAPFMAIGAWRRRRSAAFGPFLGYAVLLFGFSALVSAVHVPGGTFIHSAVALAPHAYVLALEGIVAATAFLAARRRRWRAEEATRVFLGATIVFVVLASAAGALVVQDTWRTRHEQRQGVARAMDAAGIGRDERIMSIDAAGYRYHTGRGGAVLVNDPRPEIKRVALAYDLRWLVLEAADTVPALADTLERDNRPIWLGPAIHRVPVEGNERASTIGVYPICFEGDDPRCYPVRPSP